LRTSVTTAGRARYAGYRFPAEIISHAGVVARCRSAAPSGGLLERIAEDDRSMSTRAN
jgi:hypothetical protein